MMISNAISTTMMTSRRSDRFVLMMSVSIFAVSEMKDRQVLSAFASSTESGISPMRYDDCCVEGMPVMVRGDPMLMRRMIRNLVENARLHGKPPIEVTVGRQNGQAVLNVSDHGPVIVAEARE